MYKILLLLFSSLLLLTPVQAKEQAAPAFWLAKSAALTDLLLDEKGLAAYQQTLLTGEPRTLVDLGALPWSYSPATLARWINAPDWPAAAFRNGKPDTATGEKARLLPPASIWQQQAKRVFLQYGVLTATSDLRTFPSAERFSARADSFDLLQETSLDLGEPVAILFEHPARPWLYVQTYHYRGWVEARAVARVPTRKAWLDWVKPSQRLHFLAPQTALAAQAPALRMGATLPLSAGVPAFAFLPQQNARGELTTRPIPVAAGGDLAAVPLPYTRQHILQQALRYYGTPYGWGDSGNGVDCSGFIVRVFRSVGLSLPRNADEQEAAPGWKRSLAGRTPAERRQILDDLPPASLLHMDGHVMLYLGKSDGDYWVVHAYTGHLARAADGALHYQPAMQVAISPLSLLRSDGSTYLDNLTSVRQWLPDGYSS